MFVHNNKYGRFSEIFEGTIQGRTVYFLPRHGEEHKIIVPRINYRANIWAFKELGVERILATNCVGSSNPEIELGSLVIPHDFCDWTRRFPRSLYDDEVEAYHVDMTPAYCPDLRRALIDAANQVKPGHVHDQAVIFVNEGLRFETPFELKMFRSLGADACGMSTAVEAIAARHMGMEVCGISCISNLAAGMAKKPLTHEEVQETANLVSRQFSGLVAGSIAAMGKA